MSNIDLKVIILVLLYIAYKLYCINRKLDE